MKKVHANRLFQHTADGSKLLMSLLLSVSFSFLALEGAYAQESSTAEVCRQTRAALKKHGEELAELYLLKRVKTNENAVRTDLSRLRRAITQGRVYERLDILAVAFRMETPPPSSSIEKRDYQKTVRTVLEQKLQKALNVNMDDLNLQLDRAEYQADLRTKRWDDLHCTYNVLDREEAGTTDPAILASLQRYAGTWYVGGMGGCWQTTATVSGDRIKVEGTFSGPFTDNTKYEGKWNGSAFVGSYTGDYNNPGCVSCKVTNGKRAGTFTVRYIESADALEWSSTETKDSEVFHPRTFSSTNVKKPCK